MKVKRYILCMIVLIIGIIASSIYLFDRGNKQDNAHNDLVIKQAVKEDSHDMITSKEADYFFEFAKQALESYAETHLAIIDPVIRSIQTDGLNRYFISIECIGINNDYEVEPYYCYMIIYKNSMGELGMMPFGIEIIKGNAEKIKQDLLISMLKTINGWGLESDEAKKRWQETIIGMKYANEDNEQEIQVDLGTVFYVQQVIDFINGYISDYPEEAFIKISANGIYQELLDFEIKSISSIRDYQECIVKVDGKIRIYEEESIRDYLVEMTYTVVTEPDGTFVIIRQKGKIK